MSRNRKSLRIKKKPHNKKPTPKTLKGKETKVSAFATENKPNMRGLLRLPEDKVTYPSLNLRVFIHDEDDDERARFTEMFVRSGCRKAETIYDADVVVFTGGVDVNPALYGQKPHLKTRYDEERDAQDKEMFDECALLGIPMFGVCRGMQFLHVMMGGELHQDLDFHQSKHSIYDCVGQTIVPCVSSVHHQCVAPRQDNKMLVVAYVSKSTYKYQDANTKLKSQTRDIEAVFYPGVCAFGVQGHPEYAGFPDFTVWCLKKLEDFIILNTDVEWQPTSLPKVHVHRLKEDIRVQARLDWEDYPHALSGDEIAPVKIVSRPKLTIEVANSNKKD